MQEVSVIIGGDLFPKVNQEYFSRGEVEKLFDQHIRDFFESSDLAICNLEGALTTSKDKVPKCGPSIQAPPGTAAGLKALGIDYVSLANNHVMDYGLQGYKDTVKALQSAGIGWFGAGENIHSIRTHVNIQINGISLTFYGVSETVFNIPGEKDPGANLYDEYRICRELEQLKNDCDYLIVLYHGGAEYYQYPTAWIRQRFHRMADSGADIILSQHTHCIGAEEYCNGAFFLYGQGNFYFLQDSEKELTRDGLLLEIRFSKAGFHVAKQVVSMDHGFVSCSTDDSVSDGFRERSRRLAAGEAFQDEFSAYSRKWFAKWILEFRGLRLKERILKKTMSEDRFLQYLRRSYKEKTVLRMLEHVRSEEDAEIMQRGLLDFFDRKQPADHGIK